MRNLKYFLKHAKTSWLWNAIVHTLSKLDWNKFVQASFCSMSTRHIDCTPEWQMCIHILVMVRQTLLVFRQNMNTFFYYICQLTGQMFVGPTEYVHIWTTHGDRKRKNTHTRMHRESKIHVWLCMHNKITQQKWNKISPCTFELGYLK